MVPPSEAAIRRLAGELNEDPDLLLAMAGKVSSDLKAGGGVCSRICCDSSRMSRSTRFCVWCGRFRDGDW